MLKLETKLHNFFIKIKIGKRICHKVLNFSEILYPRTVKVWSKLVQN